MQGILQGVDLVRRQAGFVRGVGRACRARTRKQRDDAGHGCSFSSGGLRHLRARDSLTESTVRIGALVVTAVLVKAIDFG